jgi:t-SNARE complex subunit (syntaxin)
LDRIDYNIEESSHAVEKGRENLEKAEGYQKKASKKLFIMLLIVVCVGLFFGIIFKKKNIDPHISHAPTAQPPRYLHF